MTEQKLPVVHTGEAGRPPYSDAVRKAILNNLKLGCPRKTAYMAAGISESTFTRWMTDIEGFRASVEAAEETSHKLYVGRLARQAAKGDTRAITFFLERKFPADWRERTSIDLTGSPEEDVEATVAADDRRRRLSDLAREADRRAASGTDGDPPVDRPDGAGSNEPA